MRKLLVTMLLSIPAIASAAAPVPRSAWIKRPAAVRDLHLKFNEPAKDFSVKRNYDNGGFN